MWKFIAMLYSKTKCAEYNIMCNVHSFSKSIKYFVHKSVCQQKRKLTGLHRLNLRLLNISVLTCCGRNMFMFMSTLCSQNNVSIFQQYSTICWNYCFINLNNVDKFITNSPTKLWLILRKFWHIVLPRDILRKVLEIWLWIDFILGNQYVASASVECYVKHVVEHQNFVCILIN